MAADLELLPLPLLVLATAALLPRSVLPTAPAIPFPALRSWFDLVVVLQTDNTVLWERLEKR